MNERDEPGWTAGRSERIVGESCNQNGGSSGREAERLEKMWERKESLSPTRIVKTYLDVPGCPRTIVNGPIVAKPAKSSKVTRPIGRRVDE